MAYDILAQPAPWDEDEQPFPRHIRIRWGGCWVLSGCAGAAGRAACGRCARGEASGQRGCRRPAHARSWVRVGKRFLLMSFIMQPAALRQHAVPSPLVHTSPALPLQTTTILPEHGRPRWRRVAPLPRSQPTFPPLPASQRLLPHCSTCTPAAHAGLCPHHPFLPDFVSASIPPALIFCPPLCLLPARLAHLSRRCQPLGAAPFLPCAPLTRQPRAHQSKYILCPVHCAPAALAGASSCTHPSTTKPSSDGFERPPHLRPNHQHMNTWPRRLPAPAGARTPTAPSPRKGKHHA